MKTVLSTKTLEPDALAYAQTLNLDVRCMDFIETAVVPFDLKNIAPESFDALVFTSANAVKYFFDAEISRNLLRGKEVFALEGKTKDELLAKGVKIDAEASSADELAEVIIDNRCRSVLHICGNLKLNVLENKLQQAGFRYQDLVVYRTDILPKKVTELYDAILFFSPSGVESFLALNNLDDKVVCCCIGSTTAQALKEKSGAAKIITPVQSLPVAMLSEVWGYWK
jgi:uroporphyrinogen-III synthase